MCPLPVAGGDQRAPEACGSSADTHTHTDPPTHTHTRSAHAHTRGLDAFRDDLVAFTKYRYPPTAPRYYGTTNGSPRTEDGAIYVPSYLHTYYYHLFI